MSSLFQQKQRELVIAVSKVEDLSRQLDILKNSKMDAFLDNQSSAAELDRMYKELQVPALLYRLFNIISVFPLTLSTQLNNNSNFITVIL